MLGISPSGTGKKTRGYEPVTSRCSRVAVNLALNLVINAYPIMLQRYNRARALPLLNRLIERDQVRATSLAVQQGSA